MSGAYTSVPDVIDYLVTTITALPECVGVEVTDGFPGTYQAQQMVCVGGGPDDDEQSAVRDFAVLGNGPSSREENYGVPVYVRCWGGGTDQKTPRDQAFAIFKAIDLMIRAGLVTAISAHYPPRIGDLILIQTKSAGATAGRVAELHFTVNVKHRY